MLVVVVFQIHTLISVNLDVIRSEEKLSKVVQPRVDVSAVVLINPIHKPPDVQREYS